MNFLCITSEFKGGPFFRALHEAGHAVFLVTTKKLEHAAWPREALAEVFYIESDSNAPEALGTIIRGMAHVMRQRPMDRVFALDDFDVEKAALLREEFRLPGMGQTTARYFRDKLAMRIRAREAGIPVPDFSPLFGDQSLADFANAVEFPCLLKPRSAASARGITKVHSADELWRAVHALGDRRHEYLAERFRPGQVYHVDALTQGGRILFCQVSRYLATPLEVVKGGIFRSVSVPSDNPEAATLRAMTGHVLQTFGLRAGASHTEFIRQDDGSFVFLETASRVGGAHLAEMVEAATGISLWTEWAKLEVALATGSDYHLPPRRYDQAGIVASLSRHEHPDTGGFTDPEIVWRMDKRQHIGLIVASESSERVLALMDNYAERIGREFGA